MRAIDLAAEMAHRGLISPEAPPLPFGSSGRPWYVSLVLGAAGWLASLFGFVFVLLLLEPDSPPVAALLGLVMLGASVALYRLARAGVFFEQLALALALAGQLALMYAFGAATESAGATAAFTAVLSAVLVLVLPNHFARLVSALFACLAWAMTIRLWWWGENWLNDPRVPVALLPALAGWLVIWVPVALGAHVLIARETKWMASGTWRVARPALTGMLFALSVGTWVTEPFAVLTFWIPTGEVAVNWLALWPLLSVAAALLAAVLASRVRHDAMVGVAIAGALLHLVQFYFLLGTTLVVKAYIMVAVGVVLLIAARTARLRATAAGRETA